MTNQLKEILRCKALLIPVGVVLGLAIFQGAVQAATLSGRLIGGELSWLNGMKQGDHVTLSNWQVMGNLQPTSEWVPGTFIGTPPKELEMTSDTGGDVTVPISVIGLEYGLGQASGIFTQQGPAHPSYNICDDVSRTSGTARLIGSNCTAPFSYLSEGELYTPFQFARPILSVDEQDLVNAFRSKKQPSGVYVGTARVTPAYLFRSPTGNWTYRNAVSVPVTVQIRYEAANLESIEVLGNGVMPAEYDTANHQVSGSTEFIVKAQGYFTEGLQMTFMDDGDGEFELDHTDTSLDASIPYSITCDDCDENRIISEGKLLLTDGETYVPGEGNSIEFVLRAHYNNIGAEQVETGNYSDAVIVLFEERL
ncbi:hypothetical protein C9I98_07215 [Photobacterium sanctipauli]|uniref:Fimbrial protein n=1 Tax=Photobacterium sanctipauli TaxID=1342794 RepID=A0A2T3NWK9_9GAMM|nr:hypothetical protein [Photobacterium sanctipauli]PSW20631.1 hypothetical protein C9I98_07215 [Photobacterium sanctipauli]